MIYLAPNNFPKSQIHFGLLISLNSQREIQKPIWAMDNGRFGKNGVNKNWNVEAWIKMLQKYQGIGGCKFCVVPDVPYDAKGTLSIFHEYLPIVSAYGYKPAICTQDGMTPDDIPWKDICAVFIGGSDAHKLGNEAIDILVAAKFYEKWTHVGRVNSAKRIVKFWYADSVDGTTIAIDGSDSNVAKIQQAVSFCQAKKQMRKMI